MWSRSEHLSQWFIVTSQVCISIPYTPVRSWMVQVNLLWPGRFSWNFRWVLFKPITVIDGWDTCCEIALRRMSLDLTDDKSTLVQVMAWCRQATSHYLNQCWPRSLPPYGVTTPQWVKYDIVTLPIRETKYFREHGQYHSCWWPGSLCHKSSAAIILT